MSDDLRNLAAEKKLAREIAQLERKTGMGTAARSGDSPVGWFIGAGGGLLLIVAIVSCHSEPPKVAAPVSAVPSINPLTPAGHKIARAEAHAMLNALAEASAACDHGFDIEAASARANDNQAMYDNGKLAEQVCFRSSRDISAIEPPAHAPPEVRNAIAAGIKILSGAYTDKGGAMHRMVGYANNTNPSPSDVAEVRSSMELAHEEQAEGTSAIASALASEKALDTSAGQRGSRHRHRSQPS